MTTKYLLSNARWGDPQLFDSMDEMKDALRTCVSNWANGDKDKAAEIENDIENLSEGEDYREVEFPDDGDELCVFITGDTLNNCFIEILTRREVRERAGMPLAPWEDDALTAYADGIGYNCTASEVEDYLVDNYADEISEFLQEYYADSVENYDAKADCETPSPWCAPWYWAKDWYGHGGFLKSALIEFAMDVCNDNSIHDAFREVTE